MLTMFTTESQVLLVVSAVSGQLKISVENQYCMLDGLSSIKMYYLSDCNSIIGAKKHYPATLRKTARQRVTYINKIFVQRGIYGTLLLGRFLAAETTSVRPWTESRIPSNQSNLIYHGNNIYV